MTLSLPTGAFAQTEPLSAQDSDPRLLGWMEGFPPAPDRLITHPHSNFFSFPKLRWSACHPRELLPTEEISHGLDAPIPLDYPAPAAFADLRQQTDAITFRR